ncbi:PRELI domain-containing protein 1, mitochondrial-like isoform X1 [Plectropomus leopardus]|uniref:PRELI domain-containing protein 1, mitochondrial-like isoform X1 n=1 Tax=Plectropomus leopardus TaxID=160734 RepID=UPI001C4CF874|nr:PRELI domain-containing protein 1, mitochondrial-like isoform X1 [Plectropomus leopardus]
MSSVSYIVPTFQSFLPFQKMSPFSKNVLNFPKCLHFTQTLFLKRCPHQNISPSINVCLSSHVLTEDVLYREVTPSNHLLSRRLLTKTNRLPGWAERVFPAHVARAVYVLEDSIVDPQTHTLTTKTWNLNHNTLMTVVERCLFEEDRSRPSWTKLRREAWILSAVYGFARPIQEFGLARFKSNQAKAMKGLEFALSKIQTEAPPRLYDDQLESSEKHKLLPQQATPTSTQNPKQFV